jgi:hypothetical protein
LGQPENGGSRGVLSHAVNQDYGFSNVANNEVHHSPLGLIVGEFWREML